MNIFSLFTLCGGLAFFLYGMTVMSKSLEKMAGGKLELLLKKMTANPFVSLALGTIITMAIQSSSATTVMIVGLVNSGIMTLTQSVGVIMGANIGTTVTGQLIRMADISGDSLWLTLIQPKTFAPVVAFIGCIFYVFLRNAKKKNIGQIMLGFGILFTGMSLMDTGVAPLRESAVFQNLFVTMTNPILGILVGVVVTVVIQSSSASVGILQALSSTGLVTFSSAIPIILGAHIGTAFTPLLTIGGSSKDGKRAALIHLYFNIIGSVILLALVYAVQFTVGIPMWNDVMNKSTIANIHTLSSVCAMLLFLPCSGVLSRLAMLTVPSSVEEAQELSMPVLDERLYKSPAVALQQAKNAVIKMSRRAARNVGLAAPLLLKMDEETVSAIKVRENLIDRMEVEITNYLIKLTDQELGDDESHAVTELLNFVTEFERIGDYARDEHSGHLPRRTLPDATEHLCDEGASGAYGVRRVLDRVAGGRECHAVVVHNLHHGDLLKAGYALLRLVVVHEDHAERRLFRKRALQERAEEHSLLVNHGEMVVRILQHGLADVVHPVGIDERLGAAVQRSIADRHRKVGLRDEERK